MKKFLITIGIILVAGIATKDTVERFKELDKISVNTPVQWEMRQPAQQQTGQRQSDIQTQNKKRFEDNKVFDENRNPNGNTLDNYNRNPDRSDTSDKSNFNDRR